MMFYNEKYERNRNIFPSMAIMFLYFLNHPSGCNSGIKAEQKYNAENCAATMVMGNDGLKAEQKYSPRDCVATVVT